MENILLNWIKLIFSRLQGVCKLKTLTILNKHTVYKVYSYIKKASCMLHWKSDFYTKQLFAVFKQYFSYKFKFNFAKDKPKYLFRCLYTLFHNIASVASVYLLPV